MTLKLSSKVLQPVLVAVILTRNTVHNFVGVRCQAVGISTLSTKTSRAIKVPNLLTDIGIEFSATIYLNHCTTIMVARVDAMSHNGRV